MSLIVCKPEAFMMHGLLQINVSTKISISDDQNTSNGEKTSV